MILWSSLSVLLNPIIEDQLKVLQDIGVTADVLQLASDEREATACLFWPENTIETAESNDKSPKKPSAKLANGDVQIVLDPEALLNKERRELIISRVFQRSVSACVVDEARFCQQSAQCN